MFSRLFVLLTLAPLVEVLLLVWIAQQTNLTVVLLLIFVPGLFGVWLARREGLRSLQVVREEMARGQIPSRSLVDGLLVLLASGLLIVPGVLTDLVGLALLVRPLRRVVGRYLTGKMEARVQSMMAGNQWAGPGRDRIIDVRVIDAESGPSREP
jgi:UPF0716 protein FxsA